MIDDNQRGLDLLALGDADAAVVCFERATTTQADAYAAYTNLGLTLLMAHRAERDIHAAIAAFHAALDSQPGSPLLFGYIGCAHSLLANDDLAIDYLIRALAEPSAFVLRHLCLLHFRAGRLREALAYVESLLAIDDRDIFRFNHALILLALGRFREGWQEFDRRAKPSCRALPEWQGEDIADQHLVLMGEGGIGDAIQFCRFIPELAARCRHLSVVERPALFRLLATSFASPQVSICTEPPEADCYVPMMGLGRVLGLDASNVGRPAYVRASTSSAWRRRLADQPHPRIGLVWGSCSGAASDRRSIPFRLLDDLLALPIRWVALQVPQHEAVTPCFDAAPFLTDWAETAGALEVLDGLISIDTGVAHLAAAMGKPVWLLNRFDSCWRWGLHGATSGWYPSMRIYRQAKLGEWTPLLRRVYDDLKATLFADYWGGG